MMENELDAEIEAAESNVEAPRKSELDKKINEYFAGQVVRKDLVKAVKGNAIVPTFVLEFLLGQYAASDDEATIQAGISQVRNILADHYVHRNEAMLVRSTIKEKGRYKVIDRISVSLNDKDDVYEATFANLGISGVLVESETIKRHPKLLVGGVWCISDVEYLHSEDQRVCPWIMGSIKPIQLSNFDEEAYRDSRGKFTTEEWIDLLMQSIGFNPEMFGRRAKLHQLVRLVPFVERNYNLVELGPKGTGKSHIYSEFSPHGMLISGGEVTVAKLFVNNSNGRLGLVGYWDVVAFDEFAGKKKRTDKALVDIMKNYMANKSFSRGVETLNAEASMVFVGNTTHTVPYMLKHSDLFDELPESYHDSAYLDRLHHYIPGWEVDVIRGEMFSSGYGFVVDFIAEILKSMRSQDYSDRYQQYFTLSDDISTRDRDGIHKTFSGLMKILYPNDEATVEEIEETLQLAIEGRKRVKDQIVRIDTTMSGVKFGYSDKSGNWKAVTTLEEREYPTYYGGESLGVGSDIESAEGTAEVSAVPSDEPSNEKPEAKALFDGHREYQESQRGITFDTLIAPYCVGANEIVIADPYIRMYHQARNLIELIEAISRTKSLADEVKIRLITTKGQEEEQWIAKQIELLENVKDGASIVGVTFSYEFDENLHDRSITTDTGWKIVLGRGLDIFQNVSSNSFDPSSRMQEFRQVKAFGITYVREN